MLLNRLCSGDFLRLLGYLRAKKLLWAWIIEFSALIPGMKSWVIIFATVHLRLIVLLVSRTNRWSKFLLYSLSWLVMICSLRRVRSCLLLFENLPRLFIYKRSMQSLWNGLLLIWFRSFINLRFLHFLISLLILYKFLEVSSYRSFTFLPRQYLWLKFTLFNLLVGLFLLHQFDLLALLILKFVDFLMKPCEWRLLCILCIKFD